MNCQSLCFWWGTQVNSQAIPIRCDRSYGRKKCVTKAQGGHKNKCYSLWIREEFLEEGDTQASTWGNNENSPVRRIEMERTLLWMNRKWAEVGGLYLTVRVVAASNSRLFSVTQVRYQRWGSMEWYQGMKRGKLLEALQLLEARFCNRAGLKGHKEKSEEMMESTRRTLFASLIGVGISLASAPPWLWSPFRSSHSSIGEEQPCPVCSTGIYEDQGNSG